MRISQMQLNDLINYPKNIRYNASMRGNVVGHMTTIFSESVNSMVKSIRFLVMSSLVEETSFKTAKLFVIRGQQTRQRSTPTRSIPKSSSRQ